MTAGGQQPPRRRQFGKIDNRGKYDYQHNQKNNENNGAERQVGSMLEQNRSLAG